MTIQLLCEGEAGALIPEVAYVRQGNRVWFVRGQATVKDCKVVESYEALDLVERALPNGGSTKLPKDGVWVIEGPSQRSDFKNANSRTYPRAIWEKWIADRNSQAQQLIRERGMLGHLEHPKDGRTDGKEGALVVVESSLRPDGTVWCKFELLDTPSGLILQEYTRKKVRWGVSSRGTGSVDETGRVNPEDYKLETWDAVMRPSVAGAYPASLQAEGAHEQAPEEAPAGARGLDENAERAIARATSLTEKPIDEADGDRGQLRASLIESLGELVFITPVARVMAVVQAVQRKLAAIDKVGEKTLDEALESAIRDAEVSAGVDPDGSGYAAVVATLARRAQESADEAEDLRAQLEVAESRSLTREWRIRELSEQLSEAKAETARVREAGQLAEELLAAMPAQAEAGEVEEAVREAVGQVPILGKVRSMLERARTSEELSEWTDALLPLVMRPATPATPVSETAILDLSRPTLPTVGSVVSESIGPRVSVPPPSRGAQLAARALRK